MKNRFPSTISSGLFLFLVSLPLLAEQPAKTYCQAKYGNEAQMTFDPIGANSSGVSDNFLNHKATQVKVEGTPKPIGFRCQILLDSDKEKKCPRGMKIDSKRNENPVCLTKKIALQELCPNELSESWPELKESICNSSAKRK